MWEMETIVLEHSLRVLVQEMVVTICVYHLKVVVQE